MTNHRKKTIFYIVFNSLEIISCILALIPWFNYVMNKPPLKYDWVFNGCAIVLQVLVAILCYIAHKQNIVKFMERIDENE